MQAPPPRPVPAKDIPSHLRVCCGGLRGNFDVQRALVILDGGREISPTEFERMAGKAASKKWKASVRIDKVHSQDSMFSWFEIISGGVNVYEMYKMASVEQP